MSGETNARNSLVDEAAVPRDNSVTVVRRGSPAVGIGVSRGFGMRKRPAIALAAAAVGAVSFLVPVASSAQIPEDVPPACIVVDNPPLHIQFGYAPNGPSDCAPLPPAAS